MTAKTRIIVASRSIVLALFVIAVALHLAGCASTGTRASSKDFPPLAPTSARDAALSSALRDYYQQWRGVPYRYGGRDTNGVDCSSFVRQTMNAVDSLALPRTTSA